jgi:hypothetical protein
LGSPRWSKQERNRLASGKPPMNTMESKSARESPGLVCLCRKNNEQQKCTLQQEAWPLRSAEGVARDQKARETSRLKAMASRSWVEEWPGATANYSVSIVCA